jgi:predicted transcriptional regulator of viral defense system
MAVKLHNYTKNVCFCGFNAKKMIQYNNIKDWVEDLPKRGKNTFSKEDAVQQFPHLTNHNIQTALYRLVLKNKIQSVWQGFFVVILPEHGMRGIVPPVQYIDQLMKFLGKNYYVALLSAAELHGAAHQAPQEFFVICNTNKLRTKVKKDVKINFVAKKNIIKKHLSQMMTRSGYIEVSSPLLTAYDLICYIKNIGGINRAATIIYDLAEKIRFTNLDKEFMQSFPPVVTQRLGYLRNELGFDELADKLYHKAQNAGLKFRKAPLVVVNKSKDLSKYQIDDKWKIIINEQIDIDQL